MIGTFTGGDSKDLLVTFTSASATSAAVQALVRDIQFTSTDNKNTTKTITYTVVDGDGTAGGGATLERPRHSSRILKPAGVAGEPIHLGLTDPTADPTDAITVTLTGVPAGWTFNERHRSRQRNVERADERSVIAHHYFAGNLRRRAGAQCFGDLDQRRRQHRNAIVVDNVEAYAPGSPIFALSGDDNLTGSSGHDLFVFSQPIGHDVIYNFDAASDQIDLIGYADFTGFGDVQAHTADDAAGNAVITLGDGQSITLHGVDAASLTADDFVFDQTPVTENAGHMVISDGAILPLSGIIDNTGTIELNSTGSETDLELIEHGITLQGHGQVILSDSAENVITGTVSDVTLTNVDNTISGAGHLGDGLIIAGQRGHDYRERHQCARYRHRRERHRKLRHLAIDRHRRTGHRQRRREFRAAVGERGNITIHGIVTGGTAVLDGGGQPSSSGCVLYECHVRCWRDWNA